MTIIFLAIVLFVPRLLDPKIPFIIYGYAVLLLPVFFKQIKRKEIRWSIPVIFFMLFLLFSSISVFFSTHKDKSLITLGLYFSYFIVFVSAKEIFKKFEDKKNIAKILTGGAVVLSIVFSYNTLIRHYVDRSPEGASLWWIYFGHGHLSGLLILILPVTIFFLVNSTRKNRLLLYVILSFLSLVFILTLSRASLISLLLAFFLLKKKIAPVFIAGIAVILIVWMSASQVNGVGKYFHFQNDPRVIYWQVAVNNFLKNPLTGSGPDTFRYLSMPKANPPVLKSFYTHNFFIQMLSDTGIFGFLAALALIAAVFKMGAKRVSVSTGKEKFFYALLMTGLLASLFNNLVDFDWQLPGIFLIFWVIAGMI